MTITEKKLKGVFTFEDTFTWVPSEKTASSEDEIILRTPITDLRL